VTAARQSHDASAAGSDDAAAVGSDTESPAASRAQSGVRNLTRETVLASDVETAAGLWGKFMGLMGRPSLADGAALWLPESNGIHMMFMRFPIDAVFVGRPDPGDGGRPVLSVHERLPTWRGLVPFVRGAHGVLELPVGTVRGTSTAVGDRLLIG
jgi:uncharacterized membrane protein (UPF0127 family)